MQISLKEKEQLVFVNKKKIHVMRTLPRISFANNQV